MSSAVRCLYDKEVRVGGRSQTSGLRVREAAMSGTIRYRPTLCHVSPLWLGPASVLSGRILLLRGIITVALYRRAPVVQNRTFYVHIVWLTLSCSAF